MDNELGRTLEAARKAKKLSLRALGEITGLNFGYIRDLELNMNRSTKQPVKPTIETLQKLAVPLDLPLDKLLSMAGYDEIVNAFENILNDPDIPEKKKELVRMIMELNDNDQELDRIIAVLNAIK